MHYKITNTLGTADETLALLGVAQSGENTFLIYNIYFQSWERIKPRISWDHSNIIFQDLY